MLAALLSLLLAALVGVVLRRRDGSFRHTAAGGPAPAAYAADAALAVPGAPATLVQVSADRCSVCPRVATVLADLAARTGVAHVELRAEDHPDLLRRHDVRRSPTVLVLDPAGRVLARASGAVTAAQAEAVLRRGPVRGPARGRHLHPGEGDLRCLRRLTATRARPAGAAAGIDPRGPRAGAAVTTVLLVGVLLLGDHTAGRVLLAVVVALFATGVALGPARSVLGLAYRVLVAPRLTADHRTRGPTPAPLRPGRRPGDRRQRPRRWPCSVCPRR